ncbi:MAG TPA: glycosyltransferase N-terminal domain-containing protein [Chlorobaculum sp.]|nr:glycosyltransferase N-terminal domain-containing protein [Chlorobaculum sp.]
MASIALAAYRSLSPLLPGMLRMLSSRVPKLKTFAGYRRNLFPELEALLRAIPEPSHRLWVHASSVGEFEQARPVIAELRERMPGLDVVVSFFSDSGYEARKTYPDASAVFYLPLDTPDNARRLVALIKPDLFMLMRYDFWPNHLLAIKRSGAKMVLAAAALPPGSPYFKPVLKGLYRDLFSLFDVIFTIDGKDRDAFRSDFGCRNAVQAGDPRFDQVYERQKRSDERAAKLKPLFGDRMVLVGGSTWEPDEAILLPAWLPLREKVSLVLVPHKVDRPNIERIMENLRQQNIRAVTIGSMDATFDPDSQVLVVDQTGYLAELYAIASIAYVGGAFGVNVHNTIEPAVHGIPVLFGPRHGNSPEAGELVAAGAASVVTDRQSLQDALQRFVTDPAHLEQAGAKAASFVQSRLGATKVIARAIEQMMAPSR